MRVWERVATYRWSGRGASIVELRRGQLRFWIDELPTGPLGDRAICRERPAIRFSPTVAARSATLACNLARKTGFRR